MLGLQSNVIRILTLRAGVLAGGTGLYAHTHAHTWGETSSPKCHVRGTGRRG